MKSLIKLQDVVLAELTENENSRKSDTELLVGVFRRMGIDTRKSFVELAESGQLRQMESITRARRKLQADHPELRDDYVSEARVKREEIFREYAKSPAVTPIEIEIKRR